MKLSMLRTRQHAKRMLVCIAATIAVAGLAGAPASQATTASTDVVLPVSGSDEQATVQDITDTPAGQALLEETRQRRASDQRAIATSATADTVEYRVLQGLPGDDDPEARWVVPKGQPLPELSDGGKVGEVVIDPGIPPVDNPAGNSILAKYLGWNTPYCYSRWSNWDAGWIDNCYQVGYVYDDGDAARVHVAFKRWATCASFNPDDLYRYVITECAVWSTPHIDPKTWEDWSPKSDSPGSNCRTLGMSITAFGIGVSGSFNACDTMNATKYSDGGHYAMSWEGNAQQSERESEFMISYNVPTGNDVRLSVGWRVDGFKYIPCC